MAPERFPWCPHDYLEPRSQDTWLFVGLRFSERAFPLNGPHPVFKERSRGPGCPVSRSAATHDSPARDEPTGFGPGREDLFRFIIIRGRPSSPPEGGGFRPKIL